ncbi:MAG: hypothetical protein J4N83_06640, partial [Chloroflexi bacterium]|nr:hypothetical protein [Chloroflexota bacterium]
NQETKSFVRRVRAVTRRKYSPDEKIEALLERLIGLSEQSQDAIDRLSEQVTEARLEQARREGFMHGRLDALRRLDE